MAPETLYLLAEHLIFSLVGKNNRKQVQWNEKLLSRESWEEFHKIHYIYDEIDFINLFDNRKELKAKKDRKCRFCGRSYPEVKFSKKAHTIPELLGNKFHLSDFECDNCNEKFGVFENDFANYLGMFRILAGIESRNGVPKYKSRDKVMSVEKVLKNAIDVNIKDVSNKNKILFNSNGDLSAIISESEPFIPLNVFRCLLKSGLSFVDDNSIKYLSNSIKFLFDETFIPDSSNNFIFKMHQYFIPGNLNTPPFLLQFKKGIKHRYFPGPSIFFVFYINNLILQIFIPFHDNDLFIYDEEVIKKLLVVPPLIYHGWFKKFGNPSSNLIALDSNIKTENMQFHSTPYYIRYNIFNPPSYT